jgi:tight adherence protein C
MLPFFLLLFVALGSAAFAGYAYIADQRRRTMLGRALGTDAVSAPQRPRAKLLAARRSELVERIRDQVGGLVPTAWVNDDSTRERLVRAGHDEESALFVYGVVRVGLLVGFPLLTLLFTAHSPALQKLMYIFVALVMSWLIPRGIVDSMVRKRQERIRRALPDALDLLIVCVEAGSSLESAILRVSRDLYGIHPDLTAELAMVLRKTKAGAPRAEALRGLWTRTGVPELRTLAGNIAQSERWGTSVGRVLRVTGETLRRKRRHSVEKRAAMATLKMTIPLVVMILPPLFLVILGPGVLQLIGTFTSNVR